MVIEQLSGSIKLDTSMMIILVDIRANNDFHDCLSLNLNFSFVAGFLRKATTVSPSRRRERL